AAKRCHGDDFLLAPIGFRRGWRRRRLKERWFASRCGGDRRLGFADRLGGRGRTLVVGRRWRRDGTLRRRFGLWLRRRGGSGFGGLQISNDLTHGGHFALLLQNFAELSGGGGWQFDRCLVRFKSGQRFVLAHRFALGLQPIADLDFGDGFAH